jgi:hypothetical protein
VSDELKGKDQTNNSKLVVLLRPKLGLQAKISMIFGWPLLAPFISGQVSGSWSDLIQTHQLRRLHNSFLIQIYNTLAPILGHNLCGL